MESPTKNDSSPKASVTPATWPDGGDISAYADELRRLPYVALAVRLRAYEAQIAALRERIESLEAARDRDG